jgi:hypothetical protein
VIENHTEKIVIGGVYRHYKGNFYKVIAVAVDTESQMIKDPAHIPVSAKRVIYHAVEKADPIWDRPYDMFIGSVTIDGTELKRFVLQ